MEKPPSISIPERLNQWIQESIMIKLLSIGILVIILLIPTAWITNLIYERQTRAARVTEEIAAKWSSAQTLTGPVLVIPYLSETVIDKGDAGKEVTQRLVSAYFLPTDLKVKGIVEPERRYRGIFEAVVYHSTLSFSTTFTKPDWLALSIDENKVSWKDVHVIFGISDLRGITDDLSIVVAGKPIETEPSNNVGVSVTPTPGPESGIRPAPGSSQGVIAHMNWSGPTDFQGDIAIDLKLKGSQRLDFIPTGKTTTVELSGPWPTPSFDGAFLPSSREVSAEGFSARWRVLHFNRPLPQQWVGHQEISGADFGVKLLVPVDQYQKSVRTAKYAVMIILLTFMALFLVEITQKVRIHPFQYILIGAALIIYYSLLLSLSEHFGYNTAYIVASLATVGLITLYSSTFFPHRALVVLLFILLLIFYGFIYVIILHEDLSLLIGSVGLFLIIAALMYFSRNVRYYKTESLE